MASAHNEAEGESGTELIQLPYPIILKIDFILKLFHFCDLAQRLNITLESLEISLNFPMK